MSTNAGSGRSRMYCRVIPLTKEQLSAPRRHLYCHIEPLPEDQLVEAACNAIKINPKNAPSAHSQDLAMTKEIALLTDTKWSTPVRLTIRFVDDPKPSRELRDRILGHFNAWGDHGDITFHEVESGATVRITVLNKDGYWIKGLGTQLNLTDPALPNMGLQDITDATSDGELCRVVRHEAGHALGFGHEHSRAAVVDLIEERRAINFFAATPNGWSEETTRFNFLTAVPESRFQASGGVDYASIMCSDVPKTVMKNHASEDAADIPGGSDFSATDKMIISATYPRQQ